MHVFLTYRALYIYTHTHPPIPTHKEFTPTTLTCACVNSPALLRGSSSSNSTKEIGKISPSLPDSHSSLIHDVVTMMSTQFRGSRSQTCGELYTCQTATSVVHSIATMHGYHMHTTEIHTPLYCATPPCTEPHPLVLHLAPCTVPHLHTLVGLLSTPLCCTVGDPPLSLPTWDNPNGTWLMKVAGN